MPVITQDEETGLQNCGECKHYKPPKSYDPRFMKGWGTCLKGHSEHMHWVPIYQMHWFQRKGAIWDSSGDLSGPGWHIHIMLETDCVARWCVDAEPKVKVNRLTCLDCTNFGGQNERFNAVFCGPVWGTCGYHGLVVYSSHSVEGCGEFSRTPLCGGCIELDDRRNWCSRHDIEQFADSRAWSCLHYVSVEDARRQSEKIAECWWSRKKALGTDNLVTAAHPWWNSVTPPDQLLEDMKLIRDEINELNAVRPPLLSSLPGSLVKFERSERSSLAESKQLSKRLRCKLKSMQRVMIGHFEQFIFGDYLPMNRLTYTTDPTHYPVEVDYQKDVWETLCRAMNVDTNDDIIEFSVVSRHTDLCIVCVLVRVFHERPLYGKLVSLLKASSRNDFKLYRHR